jgi:hypothetical protein
MRKCTHWEIAQQLERLEQLGPKFQIVGEPGRWRIVDRWNRNIGTDCKDLGTVYQRLHLAIVSAIESELSVLS